ncbi:MAG: hypothetical protein R3B72_50640 [Polyangiaceae bacterium]
MLLPAILHGPYPKVKKELRARLRELAKGATFSECLRLDDTVDSEASTDLLLLHGPNPLLNTTKAFQLFAPHGIARELVTAKKLSRDHLARAFDDSVASCAGALMLTARDNSIWLVPPDRHRAFLERARQCWKTWDSVGARYSWSSTVGTDLWSVPNTLHYVLANRGVDKAALRTPLDADGVLQLVDRTLRSLDA